jgi:hypothetical protein
MGFCFVCRYDLHVPSLHKRLTKSTISEKDQKNKIVEQRGSFHVLLLGHLVLRNLKHAGPSHAGPSHAGLAFESVMKKADRPRKLVGSEGDGHGFFNGGEYHTRTLAEADAFLMEPGWLKK